MPAPDCRVEIDDSQCRIHGVLDFDTAPQCLKEVAALIDRQAHSRIDLGGVRRANSAGLALLIEWLAQAQRVDHRVEFVDIPEGLRELAAVCQVDTLLSL